MLEFRVLGPLEALRDGQPIALGGPRERTVLAALLLRANRLASVGYLVEAVWESPPASPESNLRSYVAALRRRLGPGPHGAARLATRDGGYQLAVRPDELDLLRFAAAESRARQAVAAGDPRAAAEALAAGLGLWRGQPVEGQPPPGEALRVELAGLVERRLAAATRLAQTRIELGEYETAADELRRLAAAHPLHEELWVQLLVALCRAGRRAEALQTYARVRQRLVDELGVEPGQRLRRLHAAILTEDAALAPGHPAPAPPPPRPPAPAAPPSPASPQPALPVHQLPADTPDFSGRAAAVRRLLDELSRPAHAADDAPAGPPPVVVVTGPPGVGKTTLAVHVGHRVAPDYPDGQLFLHLAGTSERPREPAALLAELLLALGVTGPALPEGTAARAALLRSLLAARRMLLVLDDAADAPQVRALLPARATCAVLITSRRLLPDLVGARHVELGVLDEDDARALLTRIAGRERVASEPDAAAAILRACGGLPLAIRIVGGKLVGRGTWPLRLLRERLADEAERLHELRLGDLGVRASFAASVRQLPADAVRGLKLLGLLGPRPVPEWALAALLDRPAAEDVVDTLVEANLLQLAIDGNGRPRHHLHDLLRAFALEGAGRLPAADRRAAVRRFLDTLLHLAGRAAERLPRSLFRQPPSDGHGVRLPPAAVDALVADPVGWFEAERETILAAVRLAVDWRLHDVAWRLAATAVPFYDHRCLYEDWRRSHETALAAVRAQGDAQAEVTALRGLAQVHIYRDNYDAATACLREALDLARRVGFKVGEGHALSGLAIVDCAFGRYEAALENVRAALDLAASQDEHVEAHLTGVLGRIHTLLGQPEAARARFEQAVGLARRLGDTHREACLLRQVSELHVRTGAVAVALDDLARALAIVERLDDQMCVARTLLAIAQIHVDQGEGERAAPLLERAVATFARHGHLLQEATCHHLLGLLAAERRQREAARDHLGRALRLRRAIGAADKVEETSEALRRLDG